MSIDYQDIIVYYWWLLVVAIACFNAFWFLNIHKVKTDAYCPSTQEYDQAMKWLGLPFLFQAAWRSFFPVIFNLRIVYWDIWLSSAFICRGLATVGEVAWVTQIAWGLLRANQEIKTLSGSRGKLTYIEGAINWIGLFSVLLAIAAEICSFYAMTSG